MEDCCDGMGEMEAMMSKMMGGNSMDMMMEMMPECMGMMLKKMPQEKRTEVIKKLFSVLLEQGEMTEEDKKDLVNKIMGAATA